MIYGYARVSTDGQSVEAQVAALTDAGAEKIVREVASGAKTDRAQLRRLVEALAPGDVLTVARLDRLAARPATFLTSSPPSPRREQDSAPWATPGRTRRPRTAA
jgi:DNA invertase Pin-like site-specific DNA recombinase